MKDWPEEWKVTIVSKKVSKGKQQVEASTSHKSINPATNTIKETKHVKET
jgi:hypothetical protein